MKKSIYLLLLFFPMLLIGQQNQEKTVFNSTDKFAFRIGYFGNNIWNPGLIITPEYTLGAWAKTKKEKTKVREVLLHANAGFFWNPQTHVGTFTSVGLAYRKTNAKKFQSTIGINPLGYYRAFLHETYEVSDEGIVTAKPLANRGYFAPSLILGIGKKKTKRNWFFNIHFMLLNQYNLGNLPLGSIEYGYRFGGKK